MLYVIYSIGPYDVPESTDVCTAVCLDMHCGMAPTAPSWKGFDPRPNPYGATAKAVAPSLSTRLHAADARVNPI